MRTDIIEVVNYEKISRIILKNGKQVAARILKVNNDCLIIIFRDNTKGVIDLADIASITTMQIQPDKVI